MILENGVLYPDDTLQERLTALEENCLAALQGPPLEPETVIAACDTLARRIERGAYRETVQAFLKTFQIGESQFRGALTLFRRESLTYQCRMSWGENWRDLPPLRHPGFQDIRRRRMPLGILFHIAAGNVDGLPAYSVAEGLLAGNVNLLKLPSADRGLSVLLLKELTAIEPALAPFIHVFDIPSTDLRSLKKFAALADGVVVWGGDEAVEAAYRLTDCHTKIIPWGHKLSFAYATADAAETDLLALARHIRETGQTLCSSCQGVFLDTEDPALLEEFGRRLFAALLAAEGPRPDLGLSARAALSLYTDELEAHETRRIILRKKGVSVSICPDQELELSHLFGNCWVKALPRKQILPALKGKKGLLQTCGLLCAPGEREALGTLLARAGVVRVTEPGEMSRTIPGEAHDGLYPLTAYTRIVETV